METTLPELPERLKQGVYLTVSCKHGQAALVMEPAMREEGKKIHIGSNIFSAHHSDTIIIRN